MKRASICVFGHLLFEFYYFLLESILMKQSKSCVCVCAYVDLTVSANNNKMLIHFAFAISFSPSIVLNLYGISV